MDRAGRNQYHPAGTPRISDAGRLSPPLLCPLIIIITLANAKRSNPWMGRLHPIKLAEPDGWLSFNSKR